MVNPREQTEQTELKITDWDIGINQLSVESDLAADVSVLRHHVGVLLLKPVGW